LEYLLLHLGQPVISLLNVTLDESNLFLEEFELLFESFLGVLFLLAELFELEFQLVELGGQLLVALLVLLQEEDFSFEDFDFVETLVLIHNKFKF
jgi:hypothetical protein